MHISILPIVKAFEALQAKFLEEGGATFRLYTPLDQLARIKIGRIWKEHRKPSQS